VVFLRGPLARPRGGPDMRHFYLAFGIIAQFVVLAVIITVTVGH
jgi:hypothetical protein